MDKITFFVPGTPRAQGSMKWVKSKTTGKPVPIVNKNLKPWRNDIAWAAKEALGACRIVGGVSMTLVFVFERPKAHYRTGKYSHLLKDSAPDRHTQTIDLDKLQRAVLDALTGLAYTDDSQVDRIGATKRWGPRGAGAGLELTLRGKFHVTKNVL